MGGIVHVLLRFPDAVSDGVFILFVPVSFSTVHVFMVVGTDCGWLTDHWRSCGVYNSMPFHAKNPHKLAMSIRAIPINTCFFLGSMVYRNKNARNRLIYYTLFNELCQNFAIIYTAVI